MSELTGQAHFALEPLDRIRVGPVGQKEFDGRIASHQRVSRPVNDAHAAFTNFFLQRVLAELFQLEFGFAEPSAPDNRSEEHTSELQSHSDLVCRLLLEKKKV